MQSRLAGIETLPQPFKLILESNNEEAALRDYDILVVSHNTGTGPIQGAAQHSSTVNNRELVVKIKIAWAMPCLKSRGYRLRHRTETNKSEVSHSQKV